MTKKLGALAEKHQCAIVLIGHMNNSTEIRLRIGAWVRLDFSLPVARSVLLVGRVEGEQILDVVHN